MYSALYLQVVKLGSTGRKDIFQFEINSAYCEQRGPLAPVVALPAHTPQDNEQTVG